MLELFAELGPVLKDLPATLEAILACKSQGFNDTTELALMRALVQDYKDIVAAVQAKAVGIAPATPPV